MNFTKYIILMTAILTCDRFIVAKNSNLTNKDYSCWFDSTIQALSHADKLNSKLNAEDYEVGSLPRLYIRLHEKIKNNYETLKKFKRDDVIENGKTLKHFHFDTALEIDPNESKTEQKDASEFFVKILAKFVEDLIEYQKIGSLMQQEITEIISNKLTTNMTSQILSRKFNGTIAQLKNPVPGDPLYFAQYKKLFFESFEKTAQDIKEKKNYAGIVEKSIAILNSSDNLPDLKKKFLSFLVKNFLLTDFKDLNNNLKTDIENFLNKKREELESSIKNYKLEIGEFVIYTKKRSSRRKVDPLQEGKYQCEFLLARFILKQLEKNFEKAFGSDSGTFWEKDEIKSLFNKITELKEIFTLLSQEKSTCSVCNNPKIEVTKSSFLQLNIPETQNTLDYCIDCYFNDKDPLTGEKISAQSKCANCNRETGHGKTISVTQAPQVLILPLKRFKKDDYGRPEKNDSAITFDMELKLNQFFSDELKKKLENFKYKLVSFVVHRGGLTGGHYWAYGKDSNGDWFKYDDMEDTVPNVNESINEILTRGLDGSGTPCVLIYELVSPEEDFKQNLIALKSRLQELKTKLQSIQGKTTELKRKLGS